MGSKPEKCPPKIEELEAFEEDLLNMIETVQFRKTSNVFQDQLRKDMDRIKQSKDVIIPADKTRNLYSVNKEQYNKLLRNNITKSYQAAPDGTYDSINYEAKKIAKRLEVDERMDCMAKRQAYITLKGPQGKFCQQIALPLN